MSGLHRRRLFLSPGCSFERCADVLVIETRCDRLELRSPRAERLEHLLRCLRSGARPCDVLAEGEIGSDLLAALEVLQSEYLLADAEPADTASLLHLAKFWANVVFEQPFWTRLLEGRCRPPQILGWGLEFFHFVDGANVYMPLGVANARVDTELRAAIARHYVEEMNHGAIFLEGLVCCGLDRDSIVHAPPLPSTVALLNHLSELAMEGAVPYTAAFAVMQPGLTPPSVAAIEEFYGRLTALYPFAEAMFRAFSKHARIDVDLAHERTVFELLCRHEEGLGPQERRRAAAAMQSVAEAFVAFFEGIGGIVGDGDFFPRRPLCLSMRS